MKTTYWLIPLLFLLTAGMPEDGRKANDAYNNGSYARAEELYKKAIDQNPDNARLYFNLGNTLAQQKKYQEALGAFQQYRAKVKEPENKARAEYNMGNVYAEQEQWQKAMPIQQEFRQKRLEIMNKKLTMSQHQVEMLKLVNERNQQLKGILTEEQMQKLQDMQNQNRVQMMTWRNNMQQGLNLTGEQLEQMHQVNMEFRSTMQQKMTPGNPQANMQARRDMWKQHLQKMREVLNEQQLETWQLHHAIMMEQGGGMGMRAPRGNRW